MKVIKRAKQGLKRLWNILARTDMLVLPGQLAFFFLLATVPTVTLIAYGASLFNVSMDFISNFLLKAFGSDIASLITPMINDIHFSLEFLIPLFVAFYAASGGASSIIVTSNQLLNFENSSFLKRKIKGLIMTFILISLIVFLLLVPAFGDKFIELIEYVNMNQTVTNTIVFIINVSKGPISWLVIFFLVKIIYTMAPDKRMSSSYTTKGSIFTTVGFVVVTYIYSYYVNNVAHYDLLYGGLSHFVVLMIWFYLIAYIVTIGIAINAEELDNRQKLAVKKEENKQ